MLSQYFLNYGNSLFKNKQDTSNYKKINYSIKNSGYTGNFNKKELNINSNIIENYNILIDSLKTKIKR